jgi:predicted secreted protein
MNIEQVQMINSLKELFGYGLEFAPYSTMIKKIIIISLLTFSSLTSASEHQMIDTLGTSPKGQFVALEEYGYKLQSHSYYVKIKVINVWKKEYVGKSIEVEEPAIKPVQLIKARSKARILALEELKKFDIRG